MIRRFLRRRRGAVAIMAIAAMIPTTAMMSANMNAAQITDERRHTQDAADALAHMHATWTARSLNVISTNNVTTAQLLTVAIGSEALWGTLQEIWITSGLVAAHIGKHGKTHCKGLKLWIAACAANHAWVLGAGAGVASIRAADVNRRFAPKHGMAVSEKALRAIDGMNKAIVERFPAAMREIGQDYARIHDVDALHFADPCDGFAKGRCPKRNSDYGMALPLDDESGLMRLQLCTAMDRGTLAGRFTGFAARGFPDGRGPLRHGGASGTASVKEHINKRTKIGRTLRNFKRYYDRSSTVLLEINLPPWKSYKGTRGPNLLLEQRRDGPNAFTRRYDAKLVTLCDPTGVLSGIFGSALGALDKIFQLSLQAPVPKLYTLKDVSPLSPLPPVTIEDMSDPYYILAYTQRAKGDRLSAAVLSDAVEDHFGYAQAGVFNPDGADLFSPNWQYRLMPATKLDRAPEGARKLTRQAKASFRPLARALQAVSDTSGWGRIHAH